MLGMVPEATRSKIRKSPDRDWALLLRPGLGLKRWLAAGIAGVFMVGFGTALFASLLLGHAAMAPIVYWATLQFLPTWLRGVLLIAVGAPLAILGWRRIHQIVFDQLWPDLRTIENRDLLRTLIRGYRRHQGIRVVAIGGGTGMPQLLRGLRKYTDNVTAIVTVADDGGSSGRLRRQLGILPPGDFRNNIAALSEVEGLMTRLFQYRFAESDVALGGQETGQVSGQVSGLAGHSFGNLFITTMAAVTGSFEAGIAESSKVLRVRGRVLPCTLEDVTLCAEVRRTNADGDPEWLVVEGESQLPRSGGRVERVYLNPPHVRAYPEAIRAILQADLIVAGPGSLFTSVIPNLLIDAVRDAICAAQAPRVYICNITTQPGETDSYTVSDHMRQLRLYADTAFTAVLANDNIDPAHPPAAGAQWVTLPAAGTPLDYRLFTGDVVDLRRPTRHDPNKLATRIMEIYGELAGSQTHDQ
jgi:uncharacterized cofD-like protein